MRATFQAPKDEQGCRLMSGFNPLSPRRTRDTYSEHHPAATFQSALAPKDTSLSTRPFLRFQSALAPKDERYLLIVAHGSFNPLSPRRTRDIFVSLPFQSALAPKDERY